MTVFAFLSLSSCCLEHGWESVYRKNDILLDREDESDYDAIQPVL